MSLPSERSQLEDGEIKNSQSSGAEHITQKKEPSPAETGETKIDEHLSTTSKEHPHQITPISPQRRSHTPSQSQARTPTIYSMITASTTGRQQPGRAEFEMEVLLNDAYRERLAYKNRSFVNEGRKARLNYDLGMVEQQARFLDDEIAHIQSLKTQENAHLDASTKQIYLELLKSLDSRLEAATFRINELYTERQQQEQRVLEDDELAAATTATINDLQLRLCEAYRGRLETLEAEVQRELRDSRYAISSSIA